MIRQFLPIASLLLVAACASTELTPGGQKVVYATSAADISGCKAVGEVTSSGAHVSGAISGSGMKDQLRKDAIVELRNGAASKGATHVFVDETTHPDLEKGTAYTCSH